MDVLAVTDFPDIRLKTLFQSAKEDSIIIPREGGYIVRIYVEIAKLQHEEHVTNQNITSGDLIAAVNRILNPYRISLKEVAWWSVYEIDQRLCDQFDNVTTGPIGPSEHRHTHVFIAGDACHTPHPKAGQGMNVSMRDSFNLGWKFAGVLSARTRAELLNSYSTDRHAVAKVLIDFDQQWSKMISAHPRPPMLQAMTALTLLSSNSASSNMGAAPTVPRSNMLRR